MKFLSLLLTILALAAAISATAQTNNSDATAAFNRLKQLQGEWEVRSSDGKTDHISYRLIAAGSAIQEIYSGAPGDMLTVYTLDGNRVLLTHYCVAHNQPRMAATRLENGNLNFKFLDATGLESPATGHMHNVSFHFIDENHFSQNWHFVENGKEKFDENFEYARSR